MLLGTGTRHGHEVQVLVQVQVQALTLEQVQALTLEQVQALQHWNRY